MWNDYNNSKMDKFTQKPRNMYAYLNSISLSLALSKVSGPDSIMQLNWTHVFEWCAVRYRFKNDHQKGMWSKEIGPCAQNLLDLLGSNFQHNWGTCMIRKEKFKNLNLQFNNEEDAHMCSTNHKKLVTAQIGSVNLLVLRSRHAQSTKSI